MAGGKGKIHLHPNANTNGLDKRPHDAGRKRKLYSEHIKDLKDKGYEPPTKEEYFVMIGLLLSMEEEDLKEFASDKKRPYWVRLIIIDMNSKNTRQKMMSDYRDWLYGKAQQQVDLTSKGNEMQTTTIINLGVGKKPDDEKE